MRERLFTFLLFLLLSAAVQAQTVAQYTAPPQVSADAEPWFRAGSPIAWNGELYYPAGPPEAFDPYGMTRVGSYSGIPLYMDRNPANANIVLVPIAGGRVQPYLAPAMAAAAPNALRLTPEGYVAQGPIPPSLAGGYSASRVPRRMSPAVPVVAPSVGRTTPLSAKAPGPVATAGRVTTVTNSSVPGARPQGINGAWLNFDGRRYVSAGTAVPLSSDFIQAGEHRGWPVYRRAGDTTTIYVPMTSDMVAPFKPGESQLRPFRRTLRPRA
jgi:hypothetical protein